MNARKAILAGVLGLGTVMGFGSGIAAMSGCGGHRDGHRGGHAAWAKDGHRGAGCDQARHGAASTTAPAPTTKTTTPPDDAVPTPEAPAAGQE